jgi:hypothetical protein
MTMSTAIDNFTQQLHDNLEAKPTIAPGSDSQIASSNFGGFDLEVKK